MLAHNQGALLNASQIAAALGVSAQTVTRYIDLLCDLMLVRRLTPVHPNVGKGWSKRQKSMCAIAACSMRCSASATTTPSPATP